LLQFFDWMKDLTPEEEEQMRLDNWDLEDVKLGLPKDRFIQPSLINLPAEHERTINDARAVMEKVEAFNRGDEVRLSLLRFCKLCVCGCAFQGHDSKDPEECRAQPPQKTASSSRLSSTCQQSTSGRSTTRGPSWRRWRPSVWG
jgi:hypothetical protein